MSKTYSVKEVAAALGITPRGVVQRLNRNQLRGTRKTNQFGSPEWQVFATKEITQAIEAMNSTAGTAKPEQTFDPYDNFDDAIDADSVELDSQDGDWLDLERKRLEVLAETLVKPLTEQLAVQAASLREKELQLEEKDRQLRLLPDFQKQAEEERKAAELKELEAEALRKQIAALQETKQQEEETRRVLEAENENLRQKAELASLSLEKLQSLEKVVQELQKPKPSWFQKWFLPSSTSSSGK